MMCPLSNGGLGRARVLWRRKDEKINFSWLRWLQACPPLSRGWVWSYHSGWLRCYPWSHQWPPTVLSVVTPLAPNKSVCVRKCTSQRASYNVLRASYNVQCASYIALSLVTLAAVYPPINLTTCLLLFSRGQTQICENSQQRWWWN